MTTTDHTFRLLESLENVRTLSLFQSDRHGCLRPLRAIPRCAGEFWQRTTQHFASRQNYGAFNEVLQFPDVARPGMPRKQRHEFLCNGRNTFVHASSVVHCKMVN